MAKQVKVDVKKSLGYKANGRLKPSSKKERASLKSKTYICSECDHEEVFELSQFGEGVKCPKCKSAMQEKM